MEAFCADLRHPASQVCCRRSADGLLADGIHTTTARSPTWGTKSTQSWL